MSRIIVVGSVNMDISLNVEHFPAAGETILAQGSKTSGGGKGANQAAAVGKLGGDVCFIGRAGNEGYDVALKSELRAAGVKPTRWSLTRASRPAQRIFPFQMKAKIA